MLLVADPTQDVYEKQSWTDNERMLGAGFSGPWTELKGSYRMPGDIVPIANAFAQRFLTGERLSGEVLGDHDDVVQRSSPTQRHWSNIDRTRRSRAINRPRGGPAPRREPHAVTTRHRVPL